MMATLTNNKRKSRKTKIVAICPHCHKPHPAGAPWWNNGKGGWSITYQVVRNGRQCQRNRLVTKGWDSHDEAMDIWRKQEQAAECLGNRAMTEAFAAKDKEILTVETIVLRYLDHLKHGHPKTFAGRQTVLTDLCVHPKGIGTHTIRQLRDGEGVRLIREWMRAHSGWGESSRAMYCRIIKTVFNFAVEEEWIETNPIARLNRKKGNKGQWDVIRTRQHHFSARQVAAILSNSNPRGRAEDRFAMIFTALLETGCRPTELCTLTVENVHEDEQGNLYLMIDHKNQHTAKFAGRQRIVYLTPPMQGLIRQRLKQYPTGTLFRNNWGLPWRESMLSSCLRRITRRPACKALGLDRYTEGRKTDGAIKRVYDYTIYTCRHTMAVRWLTGHYRDAEGRLIVKSYGEVAELMGNSAPEVERTYGHLARQHHFLQSRMNHA